ncbi:MAG: hypothetical protein JNJ99_07870, partial [Crocinitomicaceae bacterium]|nr:hypothetical protein [Crocinitomicaceae bacterium]
KAFAISKTSPGNVEAIASPLQDLYKLSPESEEGIQAKMYLDKLYAGGSIVDPDKEMNETIDSPYKVDYAAQHFFILIIPKDAGGAEVPKVKLGNFNSEFFRQKRYTVLSSELNADNQMLVVKTFQSADEGELYVQTFTAPTSSNAVGTMPKDFQGFLITAANFSTLMSLKDLEAYKAFYEKNYQQ